MNIDTQVKYYYKQPKVVQVVKRLLLDPSAGIILISADSRDKLSNENEKIVKGIGYETKNTYQKFSQKRISGDGTVPYSSLNYCQFWKDDNEKQHIGPQVAIYELEKAEHREILQDDRLFEILLELLTCSNKE